MVLATHSFVVVNADTNLIFKGVSDLEELTCNSCRVLQCTRVMCLIHALYADAVVFGVDDALQKFASRHCDAVIPVSSAWSRAHVDHSAQWRSGSQPQPLH